MKRKYISGSFSVSVTKKSSGNQRIIEGYASTSDVDRAYDIISEDALKGAEKQLLQKGTNTVFYNHNTDIPVGKVLESKFDSKGLFVKILFSQAEDVKDIWTKVKEGIISSFSIGFRSLKRSYEQRNIDGQMQDVCIIERIKLYEVSVVGIPCNTQASVTNVTGKSLNIKGKTMDKEKVKTMSGIAKEIFEEQSKSLVDGLASLKKSVEELTLLVSNPGSESNPKKTAVKPDDKTAKTDGKSVKTDDKTDIEKLTELVKGLVETIASGKKSGDDTVSKGIKYAESDSGDSDDEDEADDKVKECFSTNVNDEKAMAYMKYAMENGEVYKALPPEKKDKVKGLYFRSVQSQKRG